VDIAEALIDTPQRDGGDHGRRAGRRRSRPGTCCPTYSRGP
jgi:hypothetical protein